jgi:hypothetical protein
LPVLPRIDLGQECPSYNSSHGGQECPSYGVFIMRSFLLEDIYDVILDYALSGAKYAA